MGEAVPPKLVWKLTADVWPGARWSRGPDFTAFDGELIVGRVFQHEAGPEKGLWFWTMPIERHGPPFPGPTCGVEKHRADAGRQVIEAYHAHLSQARAALDREGLLPEDGPPLNPQPKPRVGKRQRGSKRGQGKRQR